jgi:hypothetical protein
MTAQVQWRRGTTAQHATFTGANGEVTVDTTRKALVVHDGATAGGIAVPKLTGDTFTGAVTATALIPSDSTVPANGMYLPAANELGFATNSTYRGRFDSSGNFIVGHTAAIATGGGSTPVHQVSGTLSYAALRWNAGTGGGNVVLAHSRSGTVGTQTALVADDAMGTISFQASDGASFVNNGATIVALVDGTVSTGVTPSRIGFNTQTAAGAVTERMRIDKGGNVVINTAAIATSATDGFLYIPTCAGTPSGVPTTYTGRSAIVYDTSNNKLAVYNGTWKQTAALT